MTAELLADFEKRFAGGPLIHGNLRLPLNPNPTHVLFGPSGAGKTTLLRCLAGLERPDRGQIRFGDEVWLDADRGISLPPQRRGIGFIFQDSTLFPHLSVVENIAFGLRGMSSAAAQSQTDEMVRLLELQGLEQRFPRQLSGGQQQRVVLARALARKPRLLLLDEPLSALDVVTREQTRQLLRKLIQEIQLPTCLVTHDRDDVIGLGNTVSVLINGKVEQSGSVQQVFTHPAAVAIAKLVGMDTVERGLVLGRRGNATLIGIGLAEVLATTNEMPGVAGHVCIRAEDVQLYRDGEYPWEGHVPLGGIVGALTREGSAVRVEFNCGFTLIARVPWHRARDIGLAPGNSVGVFIHPEAIHFIPDPLQENYSGRSPFAPRKDLP